MKITIELNEKQIIDAVKAADPRVTLGVAVILGGVVLASYLSPRS
jgi:hypothetical protein